MLKTKVHLDFKKKSGNFISVFRFSSTMLFIPDAKYVLGPDSYLLDHDFTGLSLLPFIFEAMSQNYSLWPNILQMNYNLRNFCEH